MAVAEIRCPRCGSVSSLKDKRMDEYSCAHCGTTFVIIESSTKHMLHNEIWDYCRECGRHIREREGVRCVDCGRGPLCPPCTNWSPELGNRFRCEPCYVKELERRDIRCGVCGLARKGVEFYKCIVCGATRCEDHWREKFLDSDNNDIHCEICGYEHGFICKDCRYSLKFIESISKTRCPVCKSFSLKKLDWSELDKAAELVDEAELDEDKLDEDKLDEYE